MNNNQEECMFLFPYIRFFNAMPHGGSVDFYIGNTLVASGIKFGSFTPFMKTQTTRTTYKVTRAGNKDDILCKALLSQTIGQVFCLCVTGTPDKCEFSCFTETWCRDNLDYGHLRICNLSPEDESYDVFANGRKILGDIKFREMSRYMEIRPGRYELCFVKNEKKVLNCPGYEFSKGKFNTVYLCGFEKEVPCLSAEITTDSASYNGFYL